MKEEQAKRAAKKLIETVDEQIPDKNAAPKEKKKNKKVDETPIAVTKAKTKKTEKGAKETAAPKEEKAAKDDKLTKFLVSMRKSLRKSIKKEAAEIGVSMNEYIVLAVQGKLSQDSHNRP